MAPAKKKMIKLIRYIPLALLWLFVSVFTQIIYYDHNAPLLPQVGVTFLVTSLAIPASWYAAYRLVPNFLYKKQIRGFIIRLLALTLCNVAIIYIIGSGVYHLVTERPILPKLATLLLILLLLLFVNLIFISIACGVKIISDRYSLEERLLETEKEKISTELNFLRSQINPHFLFNVLNSIYFQIDRSNLAARGSVEQFSEMLRYQLYDCNTDKIEIKKEIDYIHSYVAMQSQRLEAGTDIQLISGDDLAHFSIAPFMLLTLVENAFKHISHYPDAADNKIYIDIQKKEMTLTVTVRNTYDKDIKVQHLQQSGGLGIQNLKRRLELLYPDKATLIVNHTDVVFESLLKVQLS